MTWTSVLLAAATATGSYAAAGGFSGGGGGVPSPTDVSPPPVRVEPGEKKPSQRKQRRSLATQMELSEPMIKEEKLGT